MSSHDEKHFKSTQVLRDMVIGVSDGLTVPFALAAGLSGAVASTQIIVTAGLAEIAAGSIAMGLGGYLAAKTELEHYISERRREIREVREVPEVEAREVAEIFKTYGLSEEQIQPVLKTFKAKPSAWIDFMMRFELGLEKPDSGRGRQSALTIGCSYIAGGLVPLSPYFFYKNSAEALWLSITLTVGALFIFGYVKGRFTTSKPFLTAFQTMMIGVLAAGAAFLIARLFS